MSKTASTLFKDLYSASKLIDHTAKDINDSLRRMVSSEAEGKIVQLLDVTAGLVQANKILQDKAGVSSRTGNIALIIETLHKNYSEELKEFSYADGLYIFIRMFFDELKFNQALDQTVKNLEVAINMKTLPNISPKLKRAIFLTIVETTYPDLSHIMSKKDLINRLKDGIDDEDIKGIDIDPDDL